MSEQKKYQIFSGSTLKIIALITMFIDHFALTVLYWGILEPIAPISYDSPYYKVYEIYKICRNVGRVAFPLFCFLLVEGFAHTSNRKKYLMRLAIFAVISEIPFNLAVNHQLIDLSSFNVFVTLLLGFLAIWGMEVLREKPMLMLLPPIAAGFIAHLIQCDYDYRGIILIVILYVFRHYRIYQTVFGALSLYWEWPAMFAFIPIALYNGKKGRNIKYFSYVFYPAHLLLLYFFSTMLSWLL